MSQSFVSGSGQQHVHAEQFAVRLHLASSRHSRIKSVTVSRSQPGQDACRKRQKACVLCAASNCSQASSPAAGDNGVSSVLPQSQRPRPQYVPNRIDDPNYVRIFDTTLRDGEQSPGATLTSSEKLEIAKQLAKLKVDIIEAGFPVASPDDFDAVRRIAMDVGNTRDAAGYVPVICGLSRTKLRDVEVAWDAVRLAERPRVHTFLATSPIHMEYKLRMTEDQVVENAVAAVQHLRKLGCHDIEFSPEDASRSEPRFLCRVLSEVIKAGATTVNIPDTTGWALPHEFGNLISELRKNTEGAENVIFSAHCQNDLGLATANTLAAAEAGARQLECTINGIGERAGNTSLEEVVMAIALRGEGLMNGLWTGVQPIHIAPTSRMVQDYTGMAIQPHKAIVGANAFAHESGIHQDGMLKSRQTYEIMVPETIGLTRTDAAGIVLGKHSGRHALKTRLAQLNYTLTEEQVSDVFRRFKDVADKKKRISDEDLLALMADEVYQAQVIYELIDLQVMCGSLGMPTASVKMQGPDGVIRTASGMGTGPVDASYKAIDSLVNIPVELMDYSVQSVTEGIEALAITRISLRPTGKLASEGFTTNAQGRQSQRTFSGSGADEDIVVASARAYVSGLNKLVAFMKAPKISAAERELQKLQASKPLTERTPGNAVAV